MEVKGRSKIYPGSLLKNFEDFFTALPLLCHFFLFLEKFFKERLSAAKREISQMAPTHRKVLKPPNPQQHPLNP